MTVPAAAPLDSGTTVLLPLPQLLDAHGYVPDTLRYVPRAVLKETGQPEYPALEDWIEIFRHSIASFRRTAEADPSRPEVERQRGAAQFASAYLALVNEVERQALQAGSGGTSTPGCLQLCRLREDALIAAGFTDIFLPIKAHENVSALALLPALCVELDQHVDRRERWEAVLRGVFAGNVFDLGASATTAAYDKEGGVSFHGTRAKLVARPWVIDHLDPLLDRLCSHAYKRALLFVDNSGADIILGMLPLARELVRQGATVVIAANQAPAINDVTAAELEALLPQICAADSVLCKAVSTRALQVVASGSGLPVIDLTRLSPELVQAAQGADLVVLEGMGRSIETNLHARFSCDAVNLGMIKHPEVAAALGGRLFDCVCQFRPAAPA